MLKQSPCGEPAQGLEDPSPEPGVEGRARGFRAREFCRRSSSPERSSPGGPELEGGGLPILESKHERGLWPQDPEWVPVGCGGRRSRGGRRRCCGAPAGTGLAADGKVAAGPEWSPAGWRFSARERN